MASIKWHIGCSGFHYKEWKGIFYPEGLPQRSWFGYYGQHFNTIELNTTFYRFPRVEFLEKWYLQSPPEFSFAVKAPRLITHFKQFKDSERLLDDFYTAVSMGLKEKLGTVLFQMPPKYEFTDERLARIRESLRAGFRNVIEFRHISWWNKFVYASLGSDKIIFSGISHPHLPDTPIVNTGVAYYRFHGVPRLYYSSYENSELKRIVGELKKNRSLKEVYIYFNNTADMAALENAKSLENYIG